jgi:hypothetical protein
MNIGDAGYDTMMAAVLERKEDKIEFLTTIVLDMLDEMKMIRMILERSLNRMEIKYER